MALERKQYLAEAYFCCCVSFNCGYLVSYCVWGSGSMSNASTMPAGMAGGSYYIFSSSRVSNWSADSSSSYEMSLSRKQIWVIFVFSVRILS